MNKLNEAIILAGGLGTRLRSKVSELPKSMAPINGKPFLDYQMNYLKKNGIQKVYMAIGYLADSISDYFGNTWNGIQIEYVREEEPLGTGGAISNAISHTKDSHVLICNGDTMFEVNIPLFFESYQANKADFGMALKYMQDFERYGTVTTNEEGKVTAFEEKKYQKEGYINGGIYIVNKSVLNHFDFPQKYSFEKEFLEAKFEDLFFVGFKSEAYFLDIGIPEDYEKAQKEFALLR